MCSKAAFGFALVQASQAVVFKNEEHLNEAVKMMNEGDEEGLQSLLGLADGPLQKQSHPEGTIETRPSIIQTSLLQTQGYAARHAATKRRRACACLPWAEVYKTHNVKCGQGMEFYAWLGNKAAVAENDPKLAEVRYNLADEFCSKFFERMETNRAVKVKFNTPPAEHKQAWDAAWCYVSSECGEDDLNGGGYVPGKPVHWKYSREGEDTRLDEMLPDALMRVAKNENQGSGYDMGVLGGYAYYLSMGEEQDDLSNAMLKEAASTNLVTILQPANHLAPRMIVEGVKQWKFHQNTGHQTAAPGSWWTGFKVE